MQRKNDDTDDKTSTNSDADKEELYNIQQQKKQKKKECIQKLKNCQKNRKESQPFKQPPGVETENLCRRIKYLDLYKKYKEEERKNKKTMIYGIFWGVKRLIYPREFIEEKIKKKEFERKYKNGNTILHICIIQGIDDLAKKIIEEALNTQQQNEDGLTPLHIACIQKNYEIFKYIIENKIYNLNIRDKRKRTCLHISSYQREYRFCKKLVKKRADINVQSNKCYSPLVISMMNNDYKITKMLIKNGALIEQQEGINGQTPLMTMFMQKNKKGINYLLKIGASVQTCNENMENVINMALKFMCDINKNIGTTLDGPELEKERKEYVNYLQILLKQENNRNKKGICDVSCSGRIWNIRD